MLIQRKPNQEGTGLHMARPFVVGGIHRTQVRVDLRQFTSRFAAQEGPASFSTFYTSLAANVRWAAGRFLGRLRHTPPPPGPSAESRS